MTGKAFRRKHDAGFTLVEVMAATALLVVGFLGAYASLNASGILRETTNETNRAMFKLQSAVEYVFSVPFDDITAILPPDTPVTVPGVTDPATESGLALIDETLFFSYEDPAGDPLEFTVTLTWTSQRGGQRTETLSCARAR